MQSMKSKKSPLQFHRAQSEILKGHIWEAKNREVFDITLKNLLRTINQLLVADDFSVDRLIIWVIVPALVETGSEKHHHREKSKPARCRWRVLAVTTMFMSSTAHSSGRQSDLFVFNEACVAGIHQNGWLFPEAASHLCMFSWLNDSVRQLGRTRFLTFQKYLSSKET